MSSAASVLLAAANGSSRKLARSMVDLPPINDEGSGGIDRVYPCSSSQRKSACTMHPSSIGSWNRIHLCTYPITESTTHGRSTNGSGCDLHHWKKRVACLAITKKHTCFTPPLVLERKPARSLYSEYCFSLAFV